MRLVLILVVLMSSWGTVEGKEPLTTSVVIPCAPGHVKYLYGLLKLYEQQTCLPDEVVISLSEAHKLDQNMIHSLREEPWPFALKLIFSEGIAKLNHRL